MNLTFNTKAVQELGAHTLKCKTHRNYGKGLLLVKDDGCYIMSTGLPSLTDGKRDMKLAFSKGRGEVGNPENMGSTWSHLIEGTMLATLMKLKAETFTVIVTGNKVRLVGGEQIAVDVDKKKAGTFIRDNLSCSYCKRDWADHVGIKPGDKCPDAKCNSHRVRIGLEALPERVPETAAVDNRPKRKSSAPKTIRALPAGYVSLADICKELGIETKKARIALRKSSKKPACGWAWATADVPAIKELLNGKPAPKKVKASEMITSPTVEKTKKAEAKAKKKVVKKKLAAKGKRK